MELKAEDLYNDSVQKLSPEERLRLAFMILNEVVVDHESIEYSDTWTEQDLRHLTSFALANNRNH